MKMMFLLFFSAFLGFFVWSQQPFWEDIACINGELCEDAPSQGWFCCVNDDTGNLMSGYCDGPGTNWANLAPCGACNSTSGKCIDLSTTCPRGGQTDFCENGYCCNGGDSRFTCQNNRVDQIESCGLACYDGGGQNSQCYDFGDECNNGAPCTPASQSTENTFCCDVDRVGRCDMATNRIDQTNGCGGTTTCHADFGECVDFTGCKSVDDACTDNVCCGNGNTLEVCTNEKVAELIPCEWGCDSTNLQCYDNGCTIGARCYDQDADICCEEHFGMLLYCGQTGVIESAGQVCNYGCEFGGGCYDQCDQGNVGACPTGYENGVFCCDDGGGGDLYRCVNGGIIDRDTQCPVGCESSLTTSPDECHDPCETGFFCPAVGVFCCDYYTYAECTNNKVVAGTQVPCEWGCNAATAPVSCFETACTPGSICQHDRCCARESETDLYRLGDCQGNDPRTIDFQLDICEFGCEVVPFGNDDCYGRCDVGALCPDPTAEYSCCGGQGNQERLIKCDTKDGIIEGSWRCSEACGQFDDQSDHPTCLWTGELTCDELDEENHEHVCGGHGECKRPEPVDPTNPTSIGYCHCGEMYKFIDCDPWCVPINSDKKCKETKNKIAVGAVMSSVFGVTTFILCILVIVLTIGLIVCALKWKKVGSDEIEMKE